MTLRDWLTETRDRFRRYSPATAAHESAYDFYIGALRRVGRHCDHGTPIWERDWDILILLDACRADVFNEVYDGDDRFDEMERVSSVASHSIEFMRKTFGEEWATEQADTVYICGNPFSSEYVVPHRLEHLEEVWRRGFDADVGTIPPEPVTDAAIRHYRANDPKRMIVHYMQPHLPFLVGDDRFGDGAAGVSAWDEWGGGVAFDRLRCGELSREDLWAPYRRNLQYVVEHVTDRLLCSVDADRVVLSSDHGNAFGEWGVYGHPVSVPIPALRRVPWVKTSAKNSGSYDPGEIEDTDERDRAEMLEHLGYR